MSTFIDIMTDAFQKIGYYAPGEVISDDDAEMALRVANDMLDSWSNESLSCFADLTQSVVLVPPIGQYSIGPGGVINSTRPIKITEGPGAAWLMDTNGNRYGMEVVPYDKWIMVTSNTLVNSNVPIYVYFDNQEPLAFLNFWPLPNINWTAYWTSRLQLVDFTAGLTSPLSFPPGYKKAIQDCLAVELFPYCYKGDQPPSIIVGIAQRSLGNIKRSNIRENIAIYDQSLVAKGNISYNIYTDETT